MLDSLYFLGERERDKEEERVVRFLKSEVNNYERLRLLSWKKGKADFKDVESRGSC